MAKKITFGPVLSRRLGYSLGIDLVPAKTCNLDCVYCEVGRTTQHNEVRKDYFDFQTIVEEIKNCPHEIDYLTLTGTGEPTLHAHLDELIHLLKANFSYPLVLITNSLLLREASVRQELIDIDIIMPSLDAVYQATFEKINQPVDKINVGEVIEGLVEFRKTFKGKIWLEILFCKGINDGAEELAKLKEVIAKINPEKIQLNTVVRLPPDKELAKPLSHEDLEKIVTYFADSRVEIISTIKNPKEGIVLSESELLEYIKHRPVSFEELANIFSTHHHKQLRALLSQLSSKNLIAKEVFQHEIFFKAKE